MADFPGKKTSPDEERHEPAIQAEEQIPDSQPSVAHRDALEVTEAEPANMEAESPRRRKFSMDWAEGVAGRQSQIRRRAEGDVTIEQITSRGISGGQPNFIENPGEELDDE